jgi:hypothetical protein
MSVVTSIVLMCALSEDVMAHEEPPGSIALINQWLAARKRQPLAEVADQHASGDKHPEIYLYCAGYNHFPEDEFVAFFRTLAWNAPGRVVLCLRPEEGVTRVIRPEHGPDDW